LGILAFRSQHVNAKQVNWFLLVQKFVLWRGT
jgi:hypothetical protein